MQCLECAYVTDKKSSWKNHLKSQRHRAITGHACVCDKIYATKSTLRRHERTCDVAQKLSAERYQATALTFVVDRLAHEIAETNARAAAEKLELLREQADRDARHSAEMERLLHEIAARPQTIMNNTNCTFNLATFLNDTCKNAPTLEEFMGSMPVCLDSEKPIGQFIIDQLAKCAVDERPIHCTDVKRCKLAVKQEGNTWVQDQEQIDPLFQMHINMLRQRYLRHLSDVWCVDNPKYEDPDNRQNDEYHQFIISICNDVDAKFINHVAKVTPIPKP